VLCPLSYEGGRSRAEDTRARVRIDRVANGNPGEHDALSKRVREYVSSGLRADGNVARAGATGVQSRSPGA
jgi:hypothetical protein